MWVRLHKYNEDYLYEAVEEFGSSRVVLYHDGQYFPLNSIGASIHTLAKSEDYYYYIVPQIILP